MWRIPALSLLLLSLDFAPAAGALAPTGACPPLAVTVDGRPVALPKGLGASVAEPNGQAFLVSRFNHSRMECSSYLEPVHDRGPDELVISAYVGKITNVRANGTNGIGAKAVMVATPKKIGDTISICVPQAVQHQAEWNGRTVVVRIQGLLSGTYCGRQK